MPGALHRGCLYFTNLDIPLEFVFQLISECIELVEFLVDIENPINGSLVFQLSEYG